MDKSMEQALVFYIFQALGSNPKKLSAKISCKLKKDQNNAGIQNTPKLIIDNYFYKIRLATQLMAKHFKHFQWIVY